MKGFELVRSDSAEITEDVQYKVISQILKNDEPKEIVSDTMLENWNKVTSGEASLQEVGKPSAINSDLWTYGYSKQDDGSYNYYTPQPHIRGARYANNYIEGEDISSGKPLFFYCDGVTIASDLPETYNYENKLKADVSSPTMVERNREVDAVSLKDLSNMPDGVLVDWEKMAEKTLRDPIEPITDVLGWDFDELTTEGTQSGLAQYM